MTAQEQIPRFKSGVDVVQFNVTVLDKDRHPVSGLTAADFEVLVDGQRRPLAAFAAVTLPDDPAARAASIPPVAPDVHTNGLPSEGRLVVIVMDRSVAIHDEPAARAIAHTAIDRLGPADIAGVVYTASARRTFSQGLTTDRNRLHAAVQQMENDLRLAEDELSGNCKCGVCVPDTLTTLVKTLTGGMTRRKSVLFIGSSISLTAPDPTGYCAALIYPARDRLTRALDEANVTFHAVDPHGFDPLRPPLLGMILEILPDYTGGRTVVQNNKPEQAVGPIFDEDRVYYVLAIPRDPTASKQDDRHGIKIAVKRPDVTVQARNLYFAADPASKAKPVSNAAAAALAELLPKDDFPLQMNLVPQFSPDGSPDVRVLLGVDAKVAGKLDVLIRAYDRVFAPKGTPLKQRLDVPASAVAGSSAFQWASALTLPAGDYEVRAAVATADGKRAASVIGYVEVPDVAKAQLALSGVSTKNGGVVTVQREFAPGAAIGLSFQVARAKTLAGSVSVRYSLRDDLGHAVANIAVPHERAVAVAPGVEGYDIGVRLPAVAGRYVVAIEATDGSRIARREVPVTVQ